MVKAKTELLTKNLFKYTAAQAKKKAKAFWFTKEGIAKSKVCQCNAMVFKLLRLFFQKALSEKLAKRKARKAEEKKKVEAAAKPVDGKKPAAAPVKLTKPVHKSKVPIRWYPAEGVRVHWYSCSLLKLQNCVLISKSAHSPAKLRKSLVPGTVVIILSGHFKGKRAIFLKQLPSGLLLITGPYSVNGVPLRRMNQAYVIATKTHVSATPYFFLPTFSLRSIFHLLRLMLSLTTNTSRDHARDNILREKPNSSISAAM